MKRFAALLAGILMMASASAYATPTYPALTLTSGTTEIMVEDGSALDTVAAAGIVGFSGNVGSWMLSLSTGISPLAGMPTMHLNSLNLSNAAGSLTIKFSDMITSGWIDPAGRSAVGGILAPSGSATFTTKINGTTVSSMSASAKPGSAPTPFSASEEFTYDMTGDSLVELVAELNHAYAGTSSFDFDVAPVPEPGTMLLLGAGFLGLAIYGKRRKNA